MIFPHADTMHKENFDKLLGKVDCILNKWKNQNLTILGKITIINCLVNSLFTHKLYALPTPGNQFYKKYKEKIVQFIWNGKVPKIGYNKLVQDKNKLGLKLVDLETKEVALKASLVSENIQ